MSAKNAPEIEIIAITPPATPTPTPIFAPLLRPSEEAVDEGISVFVFVLEGVIEEALLVPDRFEVDEVTGAAGDSVGSI